MISSEIGTEIKYKSEVYPEGVLVGIRIRKSSALSSAEVGVVVARKRQAFEEWPQRGNMDSQDRYGALRALVKHAVDGAKKAEHWSWG